MSYDAMSRGTVRAAWWSFILQSPLWALVNGMLPFVLFHSMGASPFQLALFTALRPMTGLLAPLWPPFGAQSAHHLRLNTACASACASLAILLALMVGGIAAWLVGAAFYLIFLRGRQVSVAEIVRCDLNEADRLRLLSRQNAVGHILSALVPLLAGMILDANPGSWDGMMLCGVLLTGLAAWMQWKLFPSHPRAPSAHSLRSWFTEWRGVAHDRRFVYYLLGFMATGSGLMVLAPMLPSLFMDQWHLTYTQVGWAVSGCKAIGFLSSTQGWVAIHRRIPLPLMNAMISLLASLFPLLLLGSQSLFWVGIAYVFYGLMQAGSELSWHNSPIHYAEGHSAVPYAASSQLMVGLRGLLVPALGSSILAFGGGRSVLWTGIAFTLLGSAWFVRSFFLERRRVVQS